MGRGTNRVLQSPLGVGERVTARLGSAHLCEHQCGSSQQNCSHRCVGMQRAGSLEQMGERSEEAAEGRCWQSGSEEVGLWGVEDGGGGKGRCI